MIISYIQHKSDSIGRKTKDRKKIEGKKMSLNNLERDVKLNKNTSRFIKSFENQNPLILLIKMKSP